MVSKGKGSRVGPGKKKMSIQHIRALSHLPGGGAGERIPPRHAQKDTSDEQQRNRTVWMMFTRKQENSEQEGQPAKAGECRAKLWC